MSLEFSFLNVVEQAAIACISMIGAGDKNKADELATEKMREVLNTLDISGEIVIGEGERDNAPMLYIGEKLGKGGEEVAIAVDPLEGTNLCAYNTPGAITVMGIGKKGSLFHAPDTYMEKIVVGKKVGKVVSLKNTVQENLENIASAYGKNINEINVVVLERDRHDKLIKDIRSAGSKIKFISDGDICGALLALTTEDTNIHALMGIGAAPEGVITAVAVNALGGYMEGKLMPYDDTMTTLQNDVVERMKKMGIDNIDKIYSASEFAIGEDLIFVATGVTDGDVLRGIEKSSEKIITESLVITNKDKKIRKIQTQHLI